MCLCLGQSYIFDYGFVSNPGIRWRIYVAIKIELFHTQSTLTPVNLWPFPIESPWPWPIITFHLLKTQLYMDCEYYHCTDTDIQGERDVCKIYDVHLSCCNWNFQKKKINVKYGFIDGWLVGLSLGLSSMLSLSLQLLFVNSLLLLFCAYSKFNSYGKLLLPIPLWLNNN